jgi:hypothetical protein
VIEVQDFEEHEAAAASASSGKVPSIAKPAAVVAIESMREADLVS